jgi:hypothetical protein
MTGERNFINKTSQTFYFKVLKTVRIFIVFFMLLFCFHLKSQIYIGRYHFGKEGCRKILKRYMNDSLYRSYENRVVTRNDRVVKSKHQAKKIIEPLAIAKYGDLKDEKPYEIHLINGLWFMKGTLCKRSVGGTIIGVLDSKTGEVLFILATK